MELLYGAGILVLMVLLWRGVKWLRDYRRRLRIRLEPVPPVPDEELVRFPELGAVRVRPRQDGEDDGASRLPPRIAPRIVPGAPAPALRAERSGAASDQVPTASVTPAATARVTATPVPVRASDDVAAPSNVFAAPAVPAASVVAGVPAASASPAAPVAPASITAPAPAPAGAPPAEEAVPVLLTPVAEPVREVQHDLFAHEPIPARPLPRKGPSAPSPAEVLYGTPVEPVRPVRTEPEIRPHVDVQDVIALHVVSRQAPFNGEDLLRCILGYGLRFGEMAIFHRHERPTGQGRILFSMAKAVEPGTFDLEAMTGEEIPGVSFFLSLPGVNSIHAFDIMVDTARRLATELQGDILDEQQQPLTRQLVEHYRERVQEFERRRLMQRPLS